MTRDPVQAEAEKEDAWDDWLSHVRACQRDCRIRGVDCMTALELRAAYRQAIQNLTEALSITTR